MKHEEVTQRVIASFYKVYNQLGYGYPERIYKRAMVLEMQSAGLKVAVEKTYEVYYSGQKIGEIVLDLVVNNVVVVELKASKALAPEHEAQLLGYLTGTELEVGLLLGFCGKPLIKRKILDNPRKAWWKKRNDP